MLKIFIFLFSCLLFMCCVIGLSLWLTLPYTEKKDLTDNIIRILVAICIVLLVTIIALVIEGGK